MKVCTKCGEDKPLTDFHKRSAAPDGLKPHCKSCVKAASRAYYEANREKKKAYYEANREEIAARNKAYYEANREEIAARDKARYEANREEILAERKAYYEANREEIAAYNKAYYEANREELKARTKAYHEANREKLTAWRKAYHAERWANDPEYRARYAAADVRRKRLLDSAVQEPYTREEIFERDNWTCQLCQEPIDSGLKWPESGFASIDHILPLSLGGDDTPANVQAAHLGCNLSKNNRVELEDQTMLTGVAG